MRNRRRGTELIEFTLLSIPVLFIGVSTIECAIGMWEYSSMENAVTVAARYAASHGASCGSPNSCTITLGTVATLIANTAPALNPSRLTVTLTTNSGTTTCNPLSSCESSTAQFPSSTDNAVGMDITIKATYKITNPLPMYWPPRVDTDDASRTLGATSRQRIQF